MSKIILYQTVKNYIESRGYILVSTQYISARSKLIIMDNEGYYYYISYNGLQNLKNLMKVHISNPYTIQNIKLWCKLNNKPFELVSKIYKNSHKNLKWQCLKEDCGEIFEMSWDNISHNHGCGVCLNKQITLSNCLATLNSELAKEWHPTKNGNLTPYDIALNYRKKVWWLCSKNPKHEWEQTPNARISSESGCPYCSGHLPFEDYNLAICFPELIAEWDYDRNKKKPEEYTPKSATKVWWKCLQNEKHHWQQQICNRSTRGDGCPYCSGRYPTEENNLLVCKPVLVTEWDYSKNKKKPEEYCPNSGQYAWWKCKKCGNEWKAIIGHRSNGIGCPECNESSGEKEINYCFKIKDFICISKDEYTSLTYNDKQKYKYYISQMSYEKLKGLGGRLLSYDFYLPQYNLLIEYQGEQHERYIPYFHKSKRDFEKQLEHDRRKREYAINNNIRLLEIWYWDFDNIEQILEKELNQLTIKAS